MMSSKASDVPDGFRLLPGYLDKDTQASLVRWLAALPAETFFTPTMSRSGQPFSVRMANLGPLGWVSDRAGYRYQPIHPETSKPWPEIPEDILAIWRALSGTGADPEACLVNYYGPKARMGLHRDADEKAIDVPVVSISLGDTAIFRLGGLTRRSPTRSVRLASGDVVLLGGNARLAYHGVDRVVPGTSQLLPQGGRYNLTLRRVNPV